MTIALGEILSYFAANNKNYRMGFNLKKLKLTVVYILTGSNDCLNKSMLIELSFATVQFQLSRLNGI